MNGRSMILLLLAVAFGLGAMLLTRQMMTTDPKREVEEQDVLVAARDLKEEESLKSDMVKLVRMAKSQVPPYSFSSFKDVEDRWVNLSLLEGDVLLEKKLGPKGTPPGLVNKIPKGMRAFSIDVNESTGVAGFILPGHRVDVVRYISSDRNRTHGETILQDLEVLAAGQTFIRPEERSVKSQTVTLAVTPEQVTILIEARAKGGMLSLSLRGVNDHVVVAKRDEKTPLDEEMEKRLKGEEEKRLKLERDLQLMKDELAKRAAEPVKVVEKTIAPPPAPPEPPATRFVAIYRAGTTEGGARPQLIQIDRDPDDEFESVSDSASPRAGDAKPLPIAKTSKGLIGNNENER